MSESENISAFLAEVKRLCDAVSKRDIERAIEAMFQAWKEERTIFLIGNGGSASTATHFAADLVQCTLSPAKKRLKAVSLFDNIPLTSALVNDRGWDSVYLEQLKTFARRGDVCIGISVHGGAGKDKAGVWSQNLLQGLQYIKDLGGTTIGLIGFDGGAMKDLVDIPILVPVSSTPLVEGFHVVLHHLIASELRARLQAGSGV
jgi:D-sedoheptulose 7-phosphate isomerase